MSKYIDADKLYERFAGLEAQALAKTKELSRIPLGTMTENEYLRWRVWSAILAERTAYKHDVFDAPTADVRENVHAKWIDESVYKQTMDGKTWDGYTYCSVCKEMHEYGYRAKFCSNCGADMRERREE